LAYYVDGSVFGEMMNETDRQCGINSAEGRKAGSQHIAVPRVKSSMRSDAQFRSSPSLDQRRPVDIKKFNIETNIEKWNGVSPVPSGHIENTLNAWFGAYR